MGSGSSRRRRAAENRRLPADGQRVLGALPTPGRRARDTQEAVGGGGGTRAEQEVSSGARQGWECREGPNRPQPLGRSPELLSRVGAAPSLAAEILSSLNGATERCALGRQPPGCPTVSYDCAEQELMASIEQEFCL
ncbi:cystin-1-like [Dryobates pubescens]|uniref:cystin-1-like n=1 Tax=Dryobates pubescens TaxID=118200 RepID=UPI0023BA114F|nr:cystin-1-like [Dryobates pubescens]